jgi:hypothetical protein
MSAVSQFPPAHLIAAEGGQGSEESVGREAAAQGPLALPAPVDEANQTKEDVKAIKGEDDTFTFDKLGPMVVNLDGTLSRIHNWSSMTQEEQQRTLRVINKRNQARLQTLKQATDEQQKGDSAIASR